MKPSVTIIGKSQIISSLSEPAIHGHSRPLSHQSMIYFNISKLRKNPSAVAVTAAPMVVQKFISIRSQGLGPIRRPLTASLDSNIRKVLKEGIKPSREKPLPQGVCLNSLNPVTARSPLRVEQLSFLSRRLTTVGSPVFLKRSFSLSKENIHFHVFCCYWFSIPLFLLFSILRRQHYYLFWHYPHFNQISK